MFKHISIINDCLDADARLRIESQVKKEFPDIPFHFYGVPIFSTLALSFLLEEGDFEEGDLILFNAAPRSDLELHKDNRSGELVFVKLKSGAWAVGPNEAYSLSLITDKISEIYTDPKNRSNKEKTQFRSAYVFPKMARIFFEEERKSFAQENLSEWSFLEPPVTSVVWIDSFGNIKLSSTETLELGKEYKLTIKRSNEVIVSFKVPYRQSLTGTKPGELALITGSSFGQKGLELIYRETLPGRKTTTRVLKENYDLEIYPEDQVEIT